MATHTHAAVFDAGYGESDANRQERSYLHAFAYPTGVQGNVVNAGTNELILPNYKQTWADTRKLASAPASVKHLSFKAQEYKAG